MAEPRAKRSSRADVESSPEAEQEEGATSFIEPADGPITKAFQLLMVLADAPGEGIGVRAISRQLVLPVSSVHRLLSVLVGAGMASRNPETRRYTIGVEAYRMAAQISRGMKLSEVAMPALRKLAAEFNETVLLGVYLEQQGQMMFAERVDGTQLLQYRIALLSPLSLVWGASGKSILAQLEPRMVKAVLSAEGPAPASGVLPPSEAELEAQLETVRRKGFAISEGEKLPGACGVAAPVFGPAGVAGCLCITSPVDRLTDVTIRSLTARIVEEAGYLSQLYGGRGIASGQAKRGSV